VIALFEPLILALASSRARREGTILAWSQLRVRPRPKITRHQVIT
jgi:hypothetical protein